MSKKFPCNFVLGVLCPHKKTAKFALLSRCFKCFYYKKFMRDMAEEDEKFDRERREIELNEVWKGL